MSLESRYTEVPTKTLTFPCLLKGKETGCIILAIGYTPRNRDTLTGITLFSLDNRHFLGEYSDCWVAANFEPFKGTVEIESK